MLAIDLTDVVYAADVGVGHLERTAHFVEEALEPVAIPLHIPRQELESHRMPELEIVRAVDLAHPAAAEQPNHAIPTIDDRARNESGRPSGRTGAVTRRCDVRTAFGEYRSGDVESLPARWTVSTAIGRFGAALWAEHCKVMLTRPSRDVKGGRRSLAASDETPRATHHTEARSAEPGARK